MPQVTVHGQGKPCPVLPWGGAPARLGGLFSETPSPAQACLYLCRFLSCSLLLGLQAPRGSSGLSVPGKHPLQQALRFQRAAWILGFSPSLSPETPSCFLRLLVGSRDDLGAHLSEPLDFCGGQGSWNSSSEQVATGGPSPISWSSSCP